MIQQCAVVREERILRCPECNESFSESDIEGETKVDAGGYTYTLIECPKCKELVAANVVETK